MTQLPTDPPDAPQAPPPADRGSRGAVALAWLAVLVTVVVVMAVGVLESRMSEEAETGGIALQVELTGKLLVASRQYFPDYGEMFHGQFDQTAVTDRERLAGAVMAGELSGPEAAVEALEDFVFEEPVNEDLVALRESLLGLYRDIVDGRSTLPSLDEEKREAIQNELGWFGRLALHAEGSGDPAGRNKLLQPLWRIPVVIVGVMVWFGFCAIAGTVVLIVFLVLAFSGKLRSRLAATGRGPIYAETFAIWFVWFFGFQLLAKMLAPPQIAMPVGLAIFWLSLLALAWPVKRGIPWAQVRQDIGLTFGRGPIVETMVGGLTYMVAVPLLLVGVIVYVLLSFVVESFFPGGGPPSHPVQDTVTGGSVPVILMVFALACVAAPIVEETMFRGVLYRHLREASGWVGVGLSVAFSAVFSSFLFAVIHPQGWIFAPVLTGLAVAFCLAREWRGSLLPCMVAHGITNALALSMNLALFRGV